MNLCHKTILSRYVIHFAETRDSLIVMSCMRSTLMISDVTSDQSGQVSDRYFKVRLIFITCKITVCKPLLLENVLNKQSFKI